MWFHVSQYFYVNDIQKVSHQWYNWTNVPSDLVMRYKILNNHVWVDADTFFARRNVNLTRRHCAKLYQFRTVSVRDGNFFSLKP